MLRVFEFDDYPREIDHFLFVMDGLHKRWPNFRGNVFAIPAEMDDRAYAEMVRRPWLRMYPHGFRHRKKECRNPKSYLPRLGVLDELAADIRWGKVFKAPWHGLDGGFCHELHERGFSFSCKVIGNRMPFPMPIEWRMWNSCNFLVRSRMNGTYDYGQFVESHPVYGSNGKSIKAMATQIDDRRIAMWTKTWSRGDTFEFVENLLEPACVKLHLGCGGIVFGGDGWVNLDPRTELDSRIVDWDSSRQIPYAECKADVAFMSHMLAYVEEEKRDDLFLEIWRVLRPQGVLRISDEFVESGFVWRHPGQDSRGTGEIKSYVSKEGVLASLRRVGFSVTETRPGWTLSPHQDVLQGDSRISRWRKGQKFYFDAVKDIELDCSRPRIRDCRATLEGRYRMPGEAAAADEEKMKAKLRRQRARRRRARRAMRARAMRVSRIKQLQALALSAMRGLRGGGVNGGD